MGQLALRICTAPGRLAGVLALVGVLLVGFTCGSSFRRIVIDEPRDGELRLGETRLQARVGNNVDEASVAVRVDGVDLVAALGLVPPFSDVNGVVSIGGVPVSVSGFRYDPAGSQPDRIEGSLTGLPAGGHTLVVEGFDPGDGTTKLATAAFEVLAGVSAGPSAVTSAGLPEPIPFASGEILANAALGGPAAAAPQATADGDTVLSGWLEAAEATLAEGGGG